MSDPSEWQFVQRRRRKGSKHDHAKLLAKNPEISTSINPSISSKSLIAKIDSKISLLSEGAGFFLERLSFATLRHCEAWGIGSMDNSVVSQFQFALFVLIVRKSNLPALFFDPVINEVDRIVIEHYGIISNPDKTSTEQNTLLYMPHCDRTLYEHILWTRSQVVFISNFFSIYSLQNPNWEAILPMITEDAMFLTQMEYTNWKKGKKLKYDCTLGVPFEAFNDLAYVEITDHPGMMQILEPLHDWCKELV